MTKKGRQPTDRFRRRVFVLKFFDPCLVISHSVRGGVEWIINKDLPNIASGLDRLVWQVTDVSEDNIAFTIRPLPLKLVPEEEVLMARNSHLFKQQIFKFANAIARIVDGLGLEREFAPRLHRKVGGRSSVCLLHSREF